MYAARRSVSIVGSGAARSRAQRTMRSANARASASSGVVLSTTLSAACDAAGAALREDFALVAVAVAVRFVMSAACDAAAARALPAQQPVERLDCRVRRPMRKHAAR